MESKKDGTEDKLWIIGDSFAGMPFHNLSWQYLIYQKFIGNHAYVSSKGSRDIQTVFDIFLEKLYKINPNDFVILFLPTLSRFRLPLKTPQMDIEWSTDITFDSKLELYKNSMIGNSFYECSITEIPKIGEEDIYKNQFTLEEPLNFINPNFFKQTEKSEDINFANVTKMINSSNAFVKNWNSILKSIQLFVPFKLIYFSWTDELDSSIIHTKSSITNELNMWHTLDDKYRETDGISGLNGDTHWSKNMNKKFAEYITNTYPNYFSYGEKKY